MTGVLQGLSAGELMTIWEQGSALDEVGRAVLLFAHGSRSSAQEALRVDLASRDRVLLSLRAATFGSRLEGFFACRQCGEQLEFALDAAQLQQDATAQAEIPAPAEGLLMRLPNSADLRRASTASSAEDGRARLFFDCVETVGGGPAALSEANLERFATWLAQASPNLETLLDLRCPACDAQEQAAFDIGPFFWREIESACGRLVREVDALARVYGWSESDILRLSPRRRAAYLQAVTQ